MAKINARNLVIKTGGVRIAGLSNCSVDTKVDMIDITTKDSAGWREILAGLGSWSLSGDGLLDYSTGANRGARELMQALINKTLVTVEFTTDVTGDWELTGSGYVSSVNKSGGNEEAAKFSFSIECTGAPTFLQI